MRTYLEVEKPDGSIAKFQPNYRDVEVFSRYAIRSIYEFYADPENMKRFEEWKSQRDQKAKGEQS